jgi:hypothetical protein
MVVAGAPSSAAQGAAAVSEKLAAFTIEYRFIDGLHVITSPDVYGLYLASSDPSAALADVPLAAQTLLHANHRLSCTVEPLPLVSDLLRSAPPEIELGMRTFLVRVDHSPAMEPHS